MEKYVTYSLNIASYIKKCGFDVEVIEDENGRYYFATDKCKEVFEAVKKYKNDKELHLYLNQFKYFKQEISKLRYQ